MGMVVQAHRYIRAAPILKSPSHTQKKISPLLYARARFFTHLRKKKRLRMQMCSNVEGKRSFLAIP